MRLVAQNVRGFPPMTQAHVRADIAATAQDAGPAGVILWQEFYRPRYRQALRSLGEGWAHYIPDVGKQCPISWRADRYQLLDAGVEFLHAGHRLITPRQFVTWVILRDRATGVEAVFTNRHYLPGAYARGFKPWRKWRVRTWEAANARDAALILRFVTQGYPVAGGGDYNVLARVRTPYGPRVGGEGNLFTRWVHYHPPAGSGVMWLWSVNSDAHVWRHEEDYTDALTPRYSDHAGRRARLRLTPRGVR